MEKMQSAFQDAVRYALLRFAEMVGVKVCIEKESEVKSLLTSDVSRR